MAGRPSFSCRPTQKMKVGISARATLRSAMLVGWRMVVVLPVMPLEGVSCGSWVVLLWKLGYCIRKGVAQHCQTRTCEDGTDPIDVVL